MKELMDFILNDIIETFPDTVNKEMYRDCLVEHIGDMTIEPKKFFEQIAKCPICSHDEYTKQLTLEIMIILSELTEEYLNGTE